MLRRSAACVRPSRRGERDANAEEATGENQLLRSERPLCKALLEAGPSAAGASTEAEDPLATQDQGGAEDEEELENLDLTDAMDDGSLR